MHSTLAFSALALALSSNVLAAPFNQARQEPISFADTVQFVVKTIGPNTGLALPNVNNWDVTPYHFTAGENVLNLTDPYTSNFSFSDAGFFRNGTGDANGDSPQSITAGFIPNDSSHSPWSLVLDLAPNKSGDPRGLTGLLKFNADVGTNGLDILNGKLVTDDFDTDSFWACSYPIDGDSPIVVEVSNRFAPALTNCQRIELWAQCAGPISAENKAAFPAFVQSSCYDVVA